jgi:hypothetical protein
MRAAGCGTVTGRKRHLLVDMIGLLLAVTITAASVQYREGAAAVVALACSKVPGLARLHVDGAYAGQCAHAPEAAHARLSVEAVRHPANGRQRVFHENQLALWSTRHRWRASRPCPSAGWWSAPTPGRALGSTGDAARPVADDRHRAGLARRGAYPRQ